VTNISSKKPFFLTDLGIIIIVISGVFVFFYWNCIQNSLPLSYEGDAFQVLVGIKGCATGENGLFSLRSFHQLNAPFVGSWCDYPFEKVLSWGTGMLSRLLGLALGSTLAVLILQVLAGVSFYACGRAMKFQRSMLIAGGVLFGLAPYAFLQNLQHLTLTAYWHLPLLVLILIWYGWPARVDVSRRDGLTFSCIAAFIAGNLNPYYLGPFLVLLGLLALGAIALRDWKRLGVFLAIVGSSVLGFLIQNLDSLIYAVKHGRNHEAVSRELWWMVKFALYLPDLFFPRAHQNPFINKASWSLYQMHAPQQLWGESQTAYIGMISATGLLLMLVAGVAFISARKFEKISPFFWLSSGTLIFSMAGGLNYLLGSFGFLLLRATNRCSILIACMALYFICEQVPQIRKDVHSRLFGITAAFLIIVGVWDQVPHYPLWEETIRQKAWADYKRDEVFFGALEKALPQGGMVFELPVKDYPEMGPILEMGDYEHFRPMLHTKKLRFTYGTVKGRGDTDWQKDLSSKSTAEMVAGLENYGFSAILINRKAYEDRGELLRREILGTKAESLAENEDFLVFRITPSDSPKFSVYQRHP